MHVGVGRGRSEAAVNCFKTAEAEVAGLLEGSVSYHRELVGRQDTWPISRCDFQQAAAELPHDLVATTLWKASAEKWTFASAWEEETEELGAKQTLQVFAFWK